MSGAARSRRIIPYRRTSTYPIGNCLDDAKSGGHNYYLTREEIIAGVRANMPTLAPCLRGARARGELTSGRHRLVLSWVVNRDASVSAPEMTGPSYLRGTSVPRCVASQMRSAWRFRAAPRQSTVRNFPIPIRVP